MILNFIIIKFKLFKMHQTLNKKFNIIQELDQAIKRKTYQKNKSKEHTNKQLISSIQKKKIQIKTTTIKEKSEQKKQRRVTPTKQESYIMRPFSFNNNENLKVETILEQKKNSQRKFEKLTSLITYMITSAEKIIKFVNTTNFEAEFAVKLFKSDKQSLQLELQAFNFEQIINQGKSNMTSQNRSRTSNLTNLQNQSLKNQNSTLKKQLMIFEAQILKLKEEKLCLNNQLKNIKVLLSNQDKKERSRIREKEKQIGNLLKQIHEIDEVKKTDKNREIILKHNLYLKQKQLERLKIILRSSSTSLDLQKYFDILEKQTKFSMIVFTNSDNFKKKSELEIILKALEAERSNLERDLTYTTSRNLKSSFGGTLSKQMTEIKRYIRQKLLPFIKAEYNDEIELENLDDIDILQILVLKLQNQQKSDKSQYKVKSEYNKSKREIQLNQKIIKLEKDLAISNNQIATLSNQLQILKIQNQKQKTEDISKLMKENQLLKANIEQVYDDLREICHLNNLLNKLNEDQINFEKIIQLIRDYISSLAATKIENSNNIKKLEQNLKEAKSIINNYDHKPSAKDTEKNILTLELATQKKINKDKQKKIQELTGEKKDLSQKIQSLKLELKQYKQIMEKQLSQLKEHIMTIQSEIQVKEKENIQLKVDINKKNLKDNTRFNKLQQQYDQLVKKFDNAKNEYEMSINDERRKFEQFNQKYQSMLNEYQQTKTKYHENYNTLEQKNNALKVEINSREESQNQKQKKIENLLDQICKKAIQNAQISKRIEQYEYNSIMYKQKIIDNESKIGQLKFENKKLQEYLLEAEQKIKKNQQLVLKLQKQLENIKNKHNVDQIEYLKLSSQVHSSEIQLQLYKQKSQSLTQKNKLLNLQIQQLTNKIIILDQKFMCSQNKNDNLIRQNQILQINIKEMKQQVQQLQNKINKFQEITIKEQQQISKVISELELKLQEDQLKIKIYIVQIEKLKSEVNNKQEQLIKNQNIITRLNNEIKNIRNEQQISKQLSNSDKQQLSCLKQKIDNLQSINYENKNTNQSLNQLNLKLQQELEDLLQKYQKICNQKDKKEEILQQLNNNYNKKQKQLQETTRQYEILQQQNQIQKKQINKIQNQYVLLNQSLNQIHLNYKQKEAISSQSIKELQTKIQEYEFAIEQVQKEKFQIKILTQNYIEELQHKYQDLEKQEQQYIQKVQQLQKENQSLKNQTFNLKSVYQSQIKNYQQNVQNLNSEIYAIQIKYQQSELQNNKLLAHFNQQKKINITDQSTQTFQEIDFNQLQILKSYLIESQKEKEIQKMKMVNYMNLIKSILKKIVDIEEIQNQDFDTLLEKGAQKVFQWKKNRVWESSNKVQIQNNNNYNNNQQVSRFQIINNEEHKMHENEIVINVVQENKIQQFENKDQKCQSHIKSNNNSIKVISKESQMEEEQQEVQQLQNSSNKKYSAIIEQQYQDQINNQQQQKQLDQQQGNQIDQFQAEISNNTSFEKSLIEQTNNINQKQQNEIYNQEFQNFQANDQLSSSMLSESGPRVEVDVNNIKLNQFLQHKPKEQKQIHQQSNPINDFSDFKQNQLSQSMISNQIEEVLINNDIKRLVVNQDKLFDEFGDMHQNDNQQLSKSLIQIENKNYENSNQHYQNYIKPNPTITIQQQQIQNDVYNLDEFRSIRDQSMQKSIIDQQNNNNFEDFPDALQKALNSSIMSNQMMDEHDNNFNIMIQGGYENLGDKKQEQFLEFLEKQQIELSGMDRVQKIQ